MKHKITFIAAGILLLILMFPAAMYFLGLFRAQPQLASSDIPQQTILATAAGSNFRQGPNQCGPYAAAMFVHTFKTGADNDPVRAVQELPWQLPGGYTHPRALESLIRSRIHGLTVQGYDAGSLEDEQKIRFLQQQLSSGFPVILLTYMYEYQHYITLLGYDADKEEFYVYDPVFTRGETGMTIDENGELPGNRNIPHAQLLSDWSEGGVAGFYSWYLLSVTR